MTICLLLGVGCDPRFFGMEYCLAKCSSVMLLKGGVVGQWMQWSTIEGTVAD